MAKRGEKIYCANSMTEAAFRSYLMNMLRKKSLYWKPMAAAKRAARCGSLPNPKTGRPNIAVKCNICAVKLLEKECKLDHLEPVIPLEGFTGDNLVCGYDWGVVIKRMFVEADGYQVICKKCHDILTKEQNLVRKSHKL